MNKYQKKLKEFKDSMQGCILQVWKEMNPEQREIREDILLKAWEEEDREGFHYSDYQILACFLSKQILYPCYDAVFKAIFLKEEDYVLLKDLISWTIFQGQRKILDLTVLPSEQPIDIFGDKIFRCDIVAVLDNNEKCNIEMQLTHHEGLCSRMVIQAAKLHVSQAKKGIEFLSIKPTLSLWIMPFDFTGFEDCYSSARLRFDQDSDKIMSDDLQFHFFEFSKALAHPEKEGLGLWRNFFSMKSIKELGRRIERGAYYEKGRKEGIKEGEIKGKIEGEIKASLDIRFGTRGLEHMQKIRSIQDLEKLQVIFTFARNAKSIEEFEEGLSSCL